MKIVKKRMLIVLITMLVITVGSVAAVYAATSAVKVTAYQGAKIIYNGKELTGTNQPYIINNVTYVPLRLIMENFGKNVSWDAANYKVIITDGGASSPQQLELSKQVAALQNQNAELQKTITALKAQVAASGKDDISTSDIKAALADAFNGAGDKYFDDSRIKFTFSLTGNKDNLAYTIKMDFGNAKKYEDITDVNDSDIEDFLDDVKKEITSEADRTVFEDAKITGKLIDSDDSNDYVKYNGSTYTYSWDEDDDTSITDIEEEVADYFKNAGDTYFDDDKVEVDISLDGDRNEIEYDVAIDCSDSDFDNIGEIGKTDLKTFLNALKSRINSEINNTDFEGADITGSACDDHDSDYEIEYEDAIYTFSW